MKEFKGDFLYVVPVNKVAVNEVVFCDVAGKIYDTQFHFNWYYDHFLVKTNTYSKKEAHLGLADQKTLKLLQLWTSRYIFGTGLINTKALVQAGNPNKMQDALDRERFPFMFFLLL